MTMPETLTSYRAANFLLYKTNEINTTSQVMIFACVFFVRYSLYGSLFRNANANGNANNAVIELDPLSCIRKNEPWL